MQENISAQRLTWCVGVQCRDSLLWKLAYGEQHTCCRICQWHVWEESNNEHHWWDQSHANISFTSLVALFPSRKIKEYLLLDTKSQSVLFVVNISAFCTQKNIKNKIEIYKLIMLVHSSTNDLMEKRGRKLREAFWSKQSNSKGKLDSCETKWKKNVVSASQSL